VAGSASRAPRRFHQRVSGGSGRYGSGISVPSRRPMMRRSSRASQRHAHTVPTSTGMPISVIAVPKPNDSAVTRNVNSITPRGSASSRYEIRR